MECGNFESYLGSLADCNICSIVGFPPVHRSIVSSTSVKDGYWACDTKIVCHQMKNPRSSVDRLVVYMLNYVRYSVRHRIPYGDKIFVDTLHIESYRSCSVEHFLYHDPMVNCVICCRKVNKCSSGNHAILEAILDVLNEVQELAGANLPRSEAVLLLDYV